MKLTISLLLLVLTGLARAASDPAKVYIFPASKQHIATKGPILSPEQARLVLAQRLDVSQYHTVDDATDEVLTYVNDFGGAQHQLFATDNDERPSQLVIVLEGVTEELIQPLKSAWAPVEPSFYISNPPSRIANVQLISDFMDQGSIAPSGKECFFQQFVNPYNEECWSGRINLVHVEAVSHIT